jgi:elongator complex protein 3
MLRLRVYPRLNLGSSRNSAVIREVHTYGKMISMGTKDKRSPQHAGLGKKLIAEAERIARKEFGLEKITVISGIGAREYYRKLGYKLRDTYMEKKI